MIWYVDRCWVIVKAVEGRSSRVGSREDYGQCIDRVSRSSCLCRSKGQGKEAKRVDECVKHGP